MRRKFISQLIITIISVSTFSACFSPYYRTHNQNEAANVAKSFADYAFIKKDKDKAFTLLIRKDKTASFDVVKLGEEIGKMHPDNKYPNMIFPLEYEIVPNTGVIRIFLKGEGSSKEEFYYQIVTIKEDNEYKVAGIFRNMDNIPYPKTPLRKSF